jgi:hypothetical protein
LVLTPSHTPSWRTTPVARSALGGNGHENPRQKNIDTHNK